MEPLMIDAKDITAIVDNDLCHSCGACANVCHPEVISFKETVAGHIFPEINYDGCTACELCSAVCPGITFGQTMTNIVEEANDPFEGKVLSTWVGQSKDKDILDNGQSGGVASAIILKAIEDDIIDTAIVAVMSNDGTIHGDVMLAYNKEDILLSQQSKYIPIPLLVALSKVKEKKERFAIVGLSCHIHGLHNVLDMKPSLKKNLIFSIGLICDRVMVSSGMDYLIEKTGINKQDVKEFYFRDKKPHGYPGHTYVKTINNSYVLDPNERMQIKDFFTPARCRICFDKMNIGCDMTIGDPHGLEGIDRKNGESLIVVRTVIGANVFDKSMNSLSVIRKASLKVALKGQHIEEKKITWRSYIEEWKNLNKPAPDYYFHVKKKTTFIENKKEKKLLYHALLLKDFNTQKEMFKLLYTIQRNEQIKKYIKLPFRVIKKIVNARIGK